MNLFRMDNSNNEGFTLAEVLITLGIIGVVAALTIPNLIANSRAHQLRSRFLKSYSTVQQAFRLMIADEADIDMRNYDRSSNPFYLTFIKYLSGATICGGYVDGNSGEEKAKNASGCYSYNIGSFYKGTDPYRYLKGISKIGDGIFNNGQILLNDGTLIFFDDGPESEGWVGVPIFIDINGAEGKPNRMGYDFFAFEVVEGTLLPMGDPNTTYYNKSDCNLNSTTLSGFTCSRKALRDSDYFKEVVRKIK